jgi:serine/threonine-protein kinase
MEVFDRTSKYDPNVDAIVRVEARRLRAKLKEYYNGPGRNDPVLIELRPGSYVPLFR